MENTQSVTIPGESLSRVPVREWTVEVLAGPDKGKKVATLEGLVKVGTDAANDLVLTDNTTSRRHLEIERTYRGLLLRDLHSRNGTFIEGRQVLQAFVEPGDSITLGKTTLTLKQRETDTELELAGGESFGELVGASESMRILFAELRRLAKEETTLLLEGEAGTGKEVAARSVHSTSGRRFGPFRMVDCAIITAESCDRDFFGPDGVFPSSEGGTLFFDEITDLPLTAQAKLARVMESKQLPAHLGQPSRKLDCHIIASTQLNLAEEVQGKRFRQDLYYRVSVSKVRMPPLRTRKADIPVLAQHLMKEFTTRLELSPQMLSMLESYDWLGNVRELRSVLERGAMMQATGKTSWLEMLVGGSDKKTPPSAGGAAPSTTLVEVMASLPYHEAKDRMTGDFEKRYFAEVMRVSNFDMKIAEEKTGLSMQSLNRLLKKNGLKLKDLKNAEGLG